MTEMNTMPSKDEAARALASKHFEIEEGMTRILRLRAAAEAEECEGEPIKLLEVNAATVPSGIMPLHFGPAPASGVPYPSIIIEVDPEEFERIESAELTLPNGWRIGEEFQ
jgi:hypothetical protein